MADDQRLDEVSLSRVRQHFKSERPVAILSAFRGESDITLDQNVANNRAMAKTFRSAGFGYVWVDGAWIETDEDTGRQEHKTEVSVLVIGQDASDEQKLYDLVIKQGLKYRQEAVVFKGADGAIKIIDPATKNVEISFDAYIVDGACEVYTRLRSGSHAGRSFVFESARRDVNIGIGGAFKRFAEFQRHENETK